MSWKKTKFKQNLNFLNFHLSHFQHSINIHVFILRYYIDMHCINISDLLWIIINIWEMLKYSSFVYVYMYLLWFRHWYSKRCQRSDMNIHFVLQVEELTEIWSCHLNYVLCLIQTNCLFCSTPVLTKRYSQSWVIIRVQMGIMSSLTLKRPNQAEFVKKSVILFWLLN